MIPDSGTRPVFFVSDHTGITSEKLGYALMTQFSSIAFEPHMLPFIDSVEHARQATREIEKAAQHSSARPLVFSTVLDDTYREIIASSEAYVIDFFDTFIRPLEQELGVASSHAAGLSHGIRNVEVYSSRMDAVNFVLNNDDGITTSQFYSADVILVGASRCGKTPTCLYLGMQYGIRAANYPLTDSDASRGALPAALKKEKGKLFGLTIKPEHLHNIREQRRQGSTYASLAQCRREIRAIEEIYAQENLPHVDTSDMSVEEIAATVMQRQHLRRRY